jgi:putative glutamine amidotransferase
MRPLILINCWRRELATYLGERTRLDTLDPAYAELVSAAGGRPLLVSRPPGGAGEEARALVAMADGIVLTGGGDVDPACYGAGRVDVRDDDPDADAFELALIGAARDLGLPTLAICRGAQLLAVAHGGRLAQRPEVVDGHPDLSGMAPDELLSQRHYVALRDGSRVARALRCDAVEVNTLHHQQIADAGELAVTATAPGGVIEAVEPRTPWPCLGVQWHPEKMRAPVQRALFEQLVRDAGAFRARAAA